MPATRAVDLTARAIIDTSLNLVLATANGTAVTTCCEGLRHSSGAHSHTAGAEWTVKHVHA